MLEGHAFPIESRLLLRMLNKIPGKQFDIYLVNEMLQRAKKAFEENGRMGEPDIAIEEGGKDGPRRRQQTFSKKMLGSRLWGGFFS